MSKKNPTFKPRHFTIKDFENRTNIHSVVQRNKWAVILTEGRFHTMQSSARGMQNPYNEWGDHVSVHHITIKIRMGLA